jgi:hypothetical protein
MPEWSPRHNGGPSVSPVPTAPHTAGSSRWPGNVPPPRPVPYPGVAEDDQRLVLSIAVLWVGYLVLGVDFGVGMLLPVLVGALPRPSASTHQHDRPVWDGNEVC